MFMIPLLAILESGDYAIIAFIVIVFAGGAAYTSRQNINLLKLELQVRDLQQKLDALLKHEGIVMPVPPPSGLSPQVEFLARDPNQKIAAIKLYREEHPGAGLAEAKLKIEEFYKNHP
jgi:ribosomal protein L7/L12